MAYNPQNPNGQATSANSEPVVIASDQSALPVSAGSLPLPAGASTAANQAASNASLSSIDGKITAVNTGAVVVSSSALPSGAATAAKQPALGTAGTAAADVLTVQGAAGMTALKVDGSAVTQPISGTVTVTPSGTQTISGTVTANAGTNLNTSALALDATLTGGTQQSKITDGTNIAHVLKSDGTAAGQNSQLTAGAYLSVPFTTTTVQAVGKTDAGNYSHVSVHVTSVGGSSTITFQISNDDTNWVSCALVATTGVTATAATSIATAGVVYTGPVKGRYFRLNVTGIVSGTTAGQIVFSAMPVGLQTMGVAAGQSGTWTVGSNSAIGSAVPASAFLIGLQNSSGNLQAVQGGAVGDGTSGNVSMSTAPMVYNGTTWDKARTGGVTGIPGVSGDVASGSTDAGNPQKIGGVGKTANPTAITDGQRVNATFDKLGKQVVVGSIRDLKGDQNTTITSSTAETTVVTAVAATFLDIYSLIVVNTSATACEVSFRDVTAGSVRFPIYVPAGETRGFTLTESAAFKQTTVNTSWTAQCATAVSSIKITALYVKNI